MKKILFVLLVALCSVSFGDAFKDCISDCKAKNIGNALADIECPNNVCAHLNPNSKDSIKSSGGIDTTGAKGGFTNNNAKGSGGGIYIEQ